MDYRASALINTTIGVLMSSLNNTIVTISLPAIFAGLGVDPTGSGQSSLLLWMMMGYTAVSTLGMLSIGRIADIFGKVRVYNIGFVIFTLGSLLCSIVPSRGVLGVQELIAFRMVQGLGGAFLVSTALAIVTDTFPPHQRGRALSANQVAFIGASVLGVVLGGVLAAINWRLIFLVNVPIGLVGTVWAFVALKEMGIRRRQPIDVWGNVTFALGLLFILAGLTLALIPYGRSGIGWANPLVLASIVSGAALLAVFAWVETRTLYPMFDLGLFRIRAFLAGSVAGMLWSLTRGGLTFMLVIWLQGVWLPLHGVKFSDTPLQAGLATLPLMGGLIAFSPIGGILADRYGARLLATVGLVVQAAGFIMLATLPSDFSFPIFAACLLVIGAGMGFFNVPNASQVMSAVPAEHRGVAAGMRGIMASTGMLASMAMYFTLVISGLGTTLPPALNSGLSSAGVPEAVAQQVAAIPPGTAVFAALLGYNPIGQLIPATTQAALSPEVLARITGPHFFANVLSQPFADAMHVGFGFSAALCLLGAVASALRGSHARSVAPKQERATAPAPISTPLLERES